MERKQRVIYKDSVEYHHCGKCKEYKIPELFYSNVKSLTGRGSYCKECMMKYTKTDKWAEWRKEKYYRNPARTIWIEARNRARKNNLPFNIEVDDCVIPEYCEVLGIKLSQKGNGTHSDSTPTLDKIIPNNGYTKGNVKVISWKANRLKSDCDDPEVFEKIAKYIKGYL
jgi:hypothetical protein